MNPLHEPDNRQFALHQAITYYTAITTPGPQYGQGQVTHAADVAHIADVFYHWLTAVTRLQVKIDPFTYPQRGHGGHGTPTIYTEGNPHMATLTDTQQVLLSVAELDAKGEPVTADTLTWVSDNPAAGVLTPSADTYSAEFVAGAPGVANITVADAANAALTGTLVLTVVSGAATSLVVSEGTPEDQPPAPPAV